MPLRRLSRLGAALALLSVAAAPAQALEERRQVYDVSVRGLKAAELEMAVNVEGDAYTVKALVRGGGLVGLFTDFSFGGVASGRIRPGGGLAPVVYQGVETGDSDRTTVINFRGGNPVSVKFSPPRESKQRDVEPRGLKGVLDPISASFSLLDDAPVGEACGRTIKVYDGLKLSKVIIGERRQERGGWACGGVYRRVSGFSRSQMEKQVDFPFTLHYRETDGMMRITRFSVETKVGDAVARRR